MMRRALLLLSAFALSVPLTMSASAPAIAAEGMNDAQALAVALADARRDADRGRDLHRHPVETVKFFKIERDMTVVDYMPSSGWWTRILVPYLSEKGRYIGVNPDVTNGSDRLKEAFGNMGSAFLDSVAQWTGIRSDRVSAYNTNTLPTDLNGKVDRIMVMREVHNIQRFNMTYTELGAMRRLLKKNGLLCIEEHRARNNAAPDYADGSKGYMREEDVIKLIEANGFKLAGKSNINANKNDPANHEAGVWVLPPNLRGMTNEIERARMLVIGESDRMTLIFKKR